jgi:D-alanine-D-alanine ligase
MTWQTPAGFKNGVLLVGHLDLPLHTQAPSGAFHRDPEWLYGEAVGATRASLVMLEYALRALKACKQIKDIPLGVLFYTDEGADCRYSINTIKKATAAAGEVLVLRPGLMGDKMINQRRGQRRYRLVVYGKPMRLGHRSRKPEALIWLCEKLQAISNLSNRKERIAVSTTEIHTEAYPLLLPHRVRVNVMLSYLDSDKADAMDSAIRDILGKEPIKWELTLVSDRPPMVDQKANKRLYKALKAVADQWEIPVGIESSLWPSAGGLVPAATPVICGMGPVTRDLYTAKEAVSRISLIQRTLLLSQYLLTKKSGSD